MKTVFSVTFFVLPFFFFFSGTIHAQNLLNSLLNNSALDSIATQARVELTTTPKSPSPNEEVTFYFDVFGSTLETNSIIWYENGVEVARGTKQISLITAPFGQTQEVRVTARSLDGKSYSETSIIQPSYVDVYYEAEAVTPPFYKGGALVPKEGSFRTYAMPYIGGSSKSPTNYDFKWYLNGQLETTQSGFGRNTLRYQGNLLSRPQTVRVEVLDGGVVIGTGEIEVNFEDPELLVYEENPLYGVLFNNALSEKTLSQEEFSVKALPYFFSPGALEYTWRLNGETVLSPETTNADGLSFGRQVSNSGTSNVSVSVDHLGKLVQSDSFNFSFSY